MSMSNCCCLSLPSAANNRPSVWNSCSCSSSAFSPSSRTCFRSLSLSWKLCAHCACSSSLEAIACRSSRDAPSARCLSSGSSGLSPYQRSWLDNQPCCAAGVAELEGFSKQSGLSVQMNKHWVEQDTPRILALGSRSRINSSRPSFDIY